MRAAVIGAGPAGLMAAEALTARGVAVDIYDAMPSFGRKFLMAGKSGLNISHAEDMDLFLARYRADERLMKMVRAFGPGEIVNWMQGLGIAAHTGSTGRIFPQMMKASPLLRAWLVRLQAAGAVLHPRHRWQGWDEAGALVFDAPGGPLAVTPDVTVVALGGASWRRLGSDGEWAATLRKAGVAVQPFGPSNCGFTLDWSDRMKRDFAGTPVKGVRLSAEGDESRAEFVITETGVESGGIYALSAPLRDALAANGRAVLTLDLLPDLDRDVLAAKLARPRGKQSMANHLRKTARLTGVKLPLLHEAAGGALPADPQALAALIKALPLTLTGTAALDAAISTTGGVAWDALDDTLMLRARPGVFCAGEMVDWDAPTGGYLITACLAMGRAAGAGAADWLARA